MILKLNKNISITLFILTLTRLIYLVHCNEKALNPNHGYAVYGSCNVSDSNWTRGCGTPIKSFLKSIILDPGQNSEKLKANFYLKENQKILSGVFLDNDTRYSRLHLIHPHLIEPAGLTSHFDLVWIFTKRKKHFGYYSQQLIRATLA